MSNGVRIIPPKPKMELFSVLSLVIDNKNMVFLEGEIHAGKKLKLKDIKIGSSVTFKVTKAVQFSDQKGMWIGPKK